MYLDHEGNRKCDIITKSELRPAPGRAIRGGGAARIYLIR